jgi:RND family efflux transporter MFP subunit
MMTLSHSYFKLTCVLAVALLLGCSGKTDTAALTTASSPAGSAPATAASAAAGPAITVTTVRAQKRDLPIVLKAAGTVTPLTSVDVKAQASTLVRKVHIRDGQFVRAGELLFTLDSRADEANVAKARAQLAKDKAALADAERQLARAQQLLAQNFISQGALDTNLALVESQKAVLAADQAAIDAAQVSLSYGRVTAPNAGRAGAISVSEGSAVQANVSTLVTITQLNPIAVAFSLPQRNLPDALAALKDGGAAVSAALADGAGSFKGRLKFVDNAVDTSSGAVKVKAVFDNPDGKLWPGAFVEVTQTVSTIQDAVIVPQAAIIQSARGTIVYVMAEGKAVLKPVKLLYAEGTDAAVSGIKPGEVVVLDGKQNLRPGVSVVERAKESAGAASGPARAKDPQAPKAEGAASAPAAAS